MIGAHLASAREDSKKTPNSSIINHLHAPQCKMQLMPSWPIRFLLHSPSPSEIFFVLELIYKSAFRVMRKIEPIEVREIPLYLLSHFCPFLGVIRAWCKRSFQDPTLLPPFSKNVAVSCAHYKTFLSWKQSGFSWADVWQSVQGSFSIMPRYHLGLELIFNDALPITTQLYKRSLNDFFPLVSGTFFAFYYLVRSDYHH